MTGKRKRPVKIANMPRKVRQKTKPKGNVATRSSNSSLALNVVRRGGAPVTKPLANGTIISHSEVVTASVVASSAYGVNNVIAIQPGISTYSRGSPMGNWLPNIATQFDNYEFVKLKLHYTPTCATTQGGLVMLGFEPNPEDNAPPDFTSFQNAARVVSAPVRERVTLDVSDKVRRKLLVRTANVNALPLYDVGKLYVATMNGSDTSVGYLEVEYEVKLVNPQTNSGTVTLPVFAGVYPTQKIRFNGGATSLPFGRTNVYRNCTGLFSPYLFANPVNDVYGDSLITFASLPAIVGSGTTTLKNGTYYVASGQLLYGFRFKSAGTYRLTFSINGDWQDYVPFRTTLATVNANGSILSARYITPTVVGLEATIPVDDTSLRGFSVPANNPVDMPLQGSTLVTVKGDELSNLFCLSVGVWSETTVVEADSGIYNINVNQDRPWVTIEYVTSATSYV